VTSLAHMAKEAHDSDAAEWGARSGLVARGLLWMAIGMLAVGLAVGQAGRADRGGALGALKGQPFGKVLLVAMAAAFAAHAGFRLLEGTVGRTEEKDDRKRYLKRAWSLCRVVIYGSFAVATVTVLLSGAKSEDATGPTAKALSLPLGRWLVAAVGAGLVIGGVVQAVRGLRQDFTKKLLMPGGRMQQVVKGAGGAGLIGRGLVYALIGTFLVSAAVNADPHKAKGLDAALKSLASKPFGTALLLIAAAGMLAFAAWSFLEARYRDV
jgi:hypothetical protein